MARHRPSRSAGTILAGLACAMLVVSCGGDPGPEVSAAGPGERAAGPESSAAPATGGVVATTDPGPLTWPLAGTVAPGGAAGDRAAVVVKIDNDPQSRPQAGLEAADLVYELEVEGITRFAAVFHSGEAETVGPIRSARSSDVDLLGNLGRPLFAWSGANPTVAGEVGGAAAAGVLVNVNQDLASQHYWRDSTRVAPYNLYSDTLALRALAPSDQSSPGPVFEYLDDGEGLAVGAIPVAGIQVSYPGDGRISEVVFAWDPERGGWPRFQVDRRHAEWDSAFRSATGAPIVPTNVVILETIYTESAGRGRFPPGTHGGDRRGHRAGRRSGPGRHVAARPRRRSLHPGVGGG